MVICRRRVYCSTEAVEAAAEAAQDAAEAVEFGVVVAEIAEVVYSTLTEEGGLPLEETSSAAENGLVLIWQPSEPQPERF
jgi:Xaa-Pro aminopeptidase